MKFFINPPDVLGIVSKSLFHSKSLVPLIRLISRIRKVKFLIFLGHDESKTSTRILENVRPYKYKEDVYWKDSKKLEDIIKKNQIYKPKSKNEFVVVPSSITKNNCIREGWPEKQIFILPLGTDTNYFKLITKKKNNKNKILFAGNGATRKGLPYLIKAVEMLQSEYNVYLTIVSHNVYDIKIKNVKVYKDITDEKLLELYKTHNIFVLPSLLDGWGLSVTEAMSCEMPVIVSNITGMSDIIKDGENGFVVSPKNHQAIYNRLKLLIKDSNLRQNTGKNARKTIKNLSWEKVGENFLKFLKYE
jgi:glycosyltransferase involved in cell wall biosynthesis